MASASLPCVFYPSHLQSLQKSSTSYKQPRLYSPCSCLNRFRCIKGFSTGFCSNKAHTVRRRGIQLSRFIVRMAPDPERATRRSPLDFPFEWESPRPGRRADILPQFSPMKTPLPAPMPSDPPFQVDPDMEEEEEPNEEDEEQLEEGQPEQPEE